MTDAAHRQSMTKPKTLSRQARQLLTGYTLVLVALIIGIIRAFTVGPIIDGSLLLTIIIFAAGFTLVARDSVEQAKLNPGFTYDEEPTWQR